MIEPDPGIFPSFIEGRGITLPGIGVKVMVDAEGAKTEYFADTLHWDEAMNKNFFLVDSKDICRLLAGLISVEDLRSLARERHKKVNEFERIQDERQAIGTQNARLKNQIELLDALLAKWQDIARVLALALDWPSWNLWAWYHNRRKALADYDKYSREM